MKVTATITQTSSCAAIKGLCGRLIAVLPFPSHPCPQQIVPESGSLMPSTCLSRCECRFCGCYSYHCRCCSTVHCPYDCYCSWTMTRESKASNPSRKHHQTRAQLYRCHKTTKCILISILTLKTRHGVAQRHPRYHAPTKINFSWHVNVRLKAKTMKISRIWNEKNPLK